MQQAAKHYRITPLFAGLFGSVAKQYDGLCSDYDVYVPYVPDIRHFVKAINADTRQFEGLEAIPAQITLSLNTSKHVRSIQINFVPFDHFVQELTRSNTDFRMALDNIVVRDCAHATEVLMRRTAMAFLDLEKVKQRGLGAANRVYHTLKEAKKEIPTSEITDSLYRLLLANATTDAHTANELFYNHTLGFTDLIALYEKQHGAQFSISKLWDGIYQDIQLGKFATTINSWREELIPALEQLIATIKPKPIVPRSPEAANLQSQQEQLKNTVAINDHFIHLLQKGNCLA